jgi:hypothetical protein
MYRRRSTGLAELFVIEVGVELDRTEEVNGFHPLFPFDILPQGLVYGFTLSAVMAEALRLLEQV